MKKSLVLTGLLLSVSALTAAEVKNSWFGGLEVGTTKYKYEASALGATVSDSESAGTQTLKFGKYLGDYGRVSIAYSNYNSEANIDANSYGIGYDYMFYSGSSFTPFIGIAAGKHKYEATGLQALTTGTTVTFSKDGIDLSGTYFTATVGTLYTLSENFDLELGARLVNMSGDDKVTLSSATASADINFELKNGSQLYLGVNYNF